MHLTTTFIQRGVQNLPIGIFDLRSRKSVKIVDFDGAQKKVCETLFRCMQKFSVTKLRSVNIQNRRFSKVLLACIFNGFYKGFFSKSEGKV
jgi:hypothetical protein